MVSGCNAWLYSDSVWLQFAAITAGWACEKNVNWRHIISPPGGAGVLQCNLPSAHRPHIPNIRTLSMLWTLWGDGRQESASWMWPWALAQKTRQSQPHAFRQKRFMIKRTNSNLLQSSTLLHFLQLQLKYSGCIDTDADPMQLAPMTHWEQHEEWFKIGSV